MNPGPGRRSGLPFPRLQLHVGELITVNNVVSQMSVHGKPRLEKPPDNFQPLGWYRCPRLRDSTVQLSNLPLLEGKEPVPCSNSSTRMMR